MSYGLATMNLSAEPRASNKPRLRLPWKKVSEDVGKNRPQDRWHVSFEQIRAMNDIQKRVMSGTEHKVAQVRNAKVILDCWGWYPRLRALRLLLEINYFKCHISLFSGCVNCVCVHVFVCTRIRRRKVVTDSNEIITQLQNTNR